MKTREPSFLRQETGWWQPAQPGASPPSTAACTLKWRLKSSGAHLYCWWQHGCSVRKQPIEQNDNIYMYFLNFIADNTPGWLHVPVHSVFRGADHGAVEVCAASETSSHLLPSTCGCGLLQGWESNTNSDRKSNLIQHTVFIYLY